MDRRNNPKAASTALGQTGMLTEFPVQAGLVEFGRTVERHIVERTWRRIRQLHVEVRAGRVVVQGRTQSYYAKQLAILAVQEALRDAGVTAVADVRVTVTAPLRRGHDPAPV